MRTVTFNIENIKYTSLNKVYSGVHWKIRKDLADEWHNLVGWIFKGLYPQFRPFVGKVTVTMIFHKKGKEMDIDNFALCSKLILDGLKGLAYEDDIQVCKLITEKEKSKENYIEVTLRNYA